MTSFSFVHAADLHLDSPFQGVTAQSERIAKKLRSATFEAFENIVKLCIDRRVDFLVVAGDVYDSEDRSLQAQLRFRDGLAQLASHGIQSFVAHGNHDPLDGWRATIDWPNGVHVFSERVETVSATRNGTPIAALTGVSYPRRQETRNLVPLFAQVLQDHPHADSCFRIGVLHTNLGKNTEHEPYAPCELSDLTSTGIDYWALGHIHTRDIIPGEPHVVYPGNPQGRSVRELNERGCVVVEVTNDRQVAVEFVPTDVVRWQVAELGIDGLSTIDGLDDALASLVEEHRDRAAGRPTVCRIRLTGRGPLYRELRRESSLPELLERTRERHANEEPFAWIETIELDCRPEIDLDQRRRSPDLVGELLRVADDLRQKPLRDELSAVLKDLYENRRVQKAVTNDLTDHQLEQLLREAELLCVDRLDVTD